MKIPINAPIIGREEISAVSSVLRSGVLTSAATDGGENVREFEVLVKNFVKSRYAVAVNSGTAALQAALYALDVQRGDEVILPSFSFVASANAVVSAGARPVFADILKENFTIDPKSILRKITKKTKAIMPVHLYGHVAFLDEIGEIAKKHNLSVVEDAAQSLGSTLQKRHTGTFFDLGCYSLYPGKVMTSGEGGVVVTNSKRLHEKLLMIRNHGMAQNCVSKTFGLNLRLPEISAAIAKMQIRRLAKFIQTRRNNAKTLSSILSSLGMQIPTERKGEQRNWLLYTIATRDRDAMLGRLHSKGIGAAVYYPVPIHKNPAYKTGLGMPNTDWASGHVLSLPVHPKVSAKDIRFIGRAIREMTDG